MANLELKTPQGGSVTLVPEDGTANVQAMIPQKQGTVIVGESVSASTTNTVTNKIAIEINGITYYLLASTSGV